MSKLYLKTLTGLVAGSFLVCTATAILAQETGSYLKAAAPVASAAYQFHNNSRLASTVSRPGNSQDYIIDNATGNWNHVFNSAYTYNTSGQLTERLGTRVSNNQVDHRFSYIYDAQGNETEYKFEIRNNNNWVTMAGSKNLRTYNAQDNVTEHILQHWTNNAWVNKDRSVYTYNAAGNLQEEILTTWANNAWLNMAKLEYIYTNGVITKISEYNHNNGAWFNNAQKVNITWHNQAKLQMTGYTQQFNFGGFTDYGRTMFVYSPTGGVETTHQSFTNGSWVNISRETTIYDAQGNFTGQKNEGWSANGWQLTSGSMIDITYNATNDITQRIFRNLDTNTLTYRDNEKVVYSNFQQFVTGVKKEMALLSARVYPNPVQGSLTIKLPETSHQVVTAIFTDVTGKTVSTHTIPAGNYTSQLPTETLPAGLYLLHLQSETQQQTIKVLKQ